MKLTPHGPVREIDHGQADPADVPLIRAAPEPTREVGQSAGHGIVGPVQLPAEGEGLGVQQVTSALAR